MATKNIVPNADGEGQLGTSSKSWAQGHIDSITGTIATAAQGNITSVGTLTALTLSGNIILPQTGVVAFNSTSDEYIQGAADQLFFGTGNLARLTLDNSNATFTGNIKIPNDGTIGSAGTAGAIKIASDGDTSLGTTQVLSKLNVKNDGSGSITRGLGLYNNAHSASGTGISLDFYVNAGDNDRCARVISQQESTGNFANLEFHTSNNGTVTKRLTIGADGNAIFTGTVNIGNGSASTPGLNFAGNGDAGFYNVGGDNIGFAANGAAVYSMNTDGITLESGKGLFVGGTGSANKLDDYEEGTWTPTLSTSGGSVGTSSSAGQYTKIGRQVIVHFQFTLSSSSGGSGTLKITNLPFSVDANSGAVIGAGRILDLGQTINVGHFTSTNQIGMFKYNGNYAGTDFFTNGFVTYFVA